MTRRPEDGLDSPLEELFTRWSAELDDIEAQLGPPTTKPFVGKPSPGQQPTEAWRAEMDQRTALLRPTAQEMALAYMRRLDEEQRRRVQSMVEEHKWVQWQFSKVISDSFERALESLSEADLDAALTLIAIYGERAGGRDFSRLLHPFFVGLQQRGLDAAAVFRSRLYLVDAHGAPERGAHAVFVRCASTG